MTDITLKVDSGYFNYRVGAIIISDNNLLMVKNENYSHYYSVGGRVNFGETAENAVLREAYEETHINFEIERLAFIHENFFAGRFESELSKPFHEISLFFLMKPHDRIKYIKSNSIGADGGKESLYWLPTDKLSDYHVFPEFFKTELLHMKNEVGHFVTREENTVRAL